MKKGIIIILALVVVTAGISLGRASVQGSLSTRVPTHVQRMISYATTCEQDQGMIGPVGIIDADEIMKLAQAGSTRVEKCAVYCLGETRDPRGVNVLCSKLNDSDPVVQRMAVRALGKIGDNSVTPLLVSVLLDGENYHRSVRSGAASALGRLGDARALRALLQTADSESGWLRHEALKAASRLDSATL